MPLGGHPELAMAIRPDTGKTGMRLDVALVSLLSFVALLHNNIGCFESSFDVAMAKFTHLRHVRWRFWFR